MGRVPGGESRCGARGVEGVREQVMRVFALPMETKHKAMREPGGFAGCGNGAGTAISQSAEYGNESVRVHYPGLDTRNLGAILWPDHTEGFCEKYDHTHLCVSEANQAVS